MATAVAVGIGTSATSVAPEPSPRSVPAWALRWPDHRNGSVPQSVLDGAVSAWRHLAPMAGAPLSGTSKVKVIWYVGQKVAHGEVVVVIFETASKAGPRLVAGWATASEVMHGQPAWTRGSSPWVLYNVAAPKPTKGLIVGLNVHGTSASAGRNPDNWIVVLSAPQVQGLGFTAAVSSSRSTTSELLGHASAFRGLVIGDVGQIEGPVQITQLNEGRREVVPHPGYVGVPGSAASQMPQLAAPGPIRIRPGFRQVIGLEGQGDTDMGLAGIHGRLAVLARCYGGGPLRIRFESDKGRSLSPSDARAQQRLLGTMACDDVVHELVTSVRLGPGPSHGVITIDGGPDTSYRVELGTAPKR
jgi:hypothetical protein